MAFVLNYKNGFEIDTTPNAADGSEKWAKIAKGIRKVECDGNEKVEQSEYYDGQGLASTEVTGGQFVYKFTGDRETDDEAQNFIMGLAMKYGEDRKTKFKQTSPDGRTITCACTIANIKDGLGEANKKDEISFEVHLNGKPTITSPAS